MCGGWGNHGLWHIHPPTPERTHFVSSHFFRALKIERLSVVRRGTWFLGS